VSVVRKGEESWKETPGRVGGGRGKDCCFKKKEAVRSRGRKHVQGGTGKYLDGATNSTSMSPQRGPHESQDEVASSDSGKKYIDER